MLIEEKIENFALLQKKVLIKLKDSKEIGNRLGDFLSNFQDNKKIFLLENELNSTLTKENDNTTNERIILTFRPNENLNNIPQANAILEDKSLDTINNQQEKEYSEDRSNLKAKMEDKVPSIIDEKLNEEKANLIGKVAINNLVGEEKTNNVSDSFQKTDQNLNRVSFRNDDISVRNIGNKARKVVKEAPLRNLIVGIMQTQKLKLPSNKGEENKTVVKLNKPPIKPRAPPKSQKPDKSVNENTDILEKQNSKLRSINITKNTNKAASLGFLDDKSQKEILFRSENSLAVTPHAEFQYVNESSCNHHESSSLVHQAQSPPVTEEKQSVPQNYNEPFDSIINLKIIKTPLFSNKMEDEEKLMSKNGKEVFQSREESDIESEEC